ncbi:solute carrier family 28 member 3-like [Rhinoraja longicauda]
MSRNCKNRLTCAVCKGEHPEILHFEQKDIKPKPEQPAKEKASQSDATPLSPMCGHIGAGEETCIFSIVPVQVKSMLNIHRQEVLKQWHYLKNIKITEIDSGIDLLIGTNASKVLESWEVIHSKEDGPFAMKTLLEWVVCGPLRENHDNSVGEGFPTVVINRISVVNLEELLVKQYNHDFNEESSKDKEEMSREEVYLFGAVLSPSCANFALRKTAEDNGAHFSEEVVDTVKNNFYVVDCLKSMPSEPEAVRMELCKEKLGWDDDIPQTFHQRWTGWLTDLDKIVEFEVDRGLYIAMVTFTVLWLALDTWKEGADQIISFFGLCMLVILTFIFSKYPGKVKWRTVFWGIGLQFILALLILRTHTGFVAVNWLGIQVQIFMNYVDAGAKFLFGEKYTDHYFAFKVLPLVIYFSSVISILYHLGFIQWLIMKIGWLMQVTMGTSPTESLVAASNMFVGQTESPLMIRPYLKDLTLSEMHSVMCSGFATIAGSVLGAYISFGVPAAHLLTASVMSAPAALAIGKLFWPETEKAKITVNTNIKFDKSEASNVIEAACLGAGAAIPLVANIAANLIAFLSLLSFLNATLSWVGHMFNEPDLNFELICSYVFMPLAFMMGVDWTDSFLVAELLGIKTFFNEFVAYLKLAELIKRRKDGLPEFIGNRKQYLSVRSETIATYALCGFANIGSVGIVIGGLSSIAPTRFRDIASVSLRALIAGTVACFMTACVAGMITKTLLLITCCKRAKTGMYY